MLARPSVADENGAAAGGKPGAVGRPRAALGELSNVMSLRGAAGGKDGGKPDAGRVTDMSALLNNIREKTQTWGNTGKRTVAPAARPGRASEAGSAGRASALAGSRSLSTLLQKRADAESDPLPDIDAADKENPLAVAEYVNSIYSYYHRVEPQTAVSPSYMGAQTDINEKMRAILVDWLVEVHLKFKLMPETLFLTVNLIDRYLATAPVTRKNLQLVGVTAMLLASKYEEIWAPEVRDFVYISDKAYTREQILGCEKGMLNTLGFHLTVPTPFQFLSRLVKAAAADKPLAHLAQYYVELALPEYACLRYKGSELAAAAMYCAIRAARGVAPGSPDCWTHALERHSRYTEAALLPCANALARLQRKAAGASLTAVYKKYSNAKFHEVAKLPAADGLGDDAMQA